MITASVTAMPIATTAFLSPPWLLALPSDDFSAASVRAATSAGAAGAAGEADDIGSLSAVGLAARTPGSACRVATGCVLRDPYGLSLQIGRPRPVLEDQAACRV